MKLQLPLSDLHSAVRVSAKTPKGLIETTLDNSHKTVDIDLPAGIHEDDVEVVAEFLTNQGIVDKAVEPVVLKTLVVKAPKATPKPAAPKVETKEEPAKADSEK